MRPRAMSGSLPAMRSSIERFTNEAVPGQPRRSRHEQPRILRHLVQITLMAGTMCLLPSVQAKSVAAISALTPMTAPSLDLMRDVPLLVAPTGNPWFCFGGRCIGTTTAQRDVDELLRGMSQPLAPDVQPLLVAPNCPNCWPKPNIGRAQPSIQRDESFDTTRFL